MHVYKQLSRHSLGIIVYPLHMFELSLIVIIIFVMPAWKQFYHYVLIKVIATSAIIKQSWSAGPFIIIVIVRCCWEEGSWKQGDRICSQKNKTSSNSKLTNQTELICDGNLANRKTNDMKSQGSKKVIYLTLLMKIMPAVREKQLKR